MDSITHILSGALWTEPVRRPLGAKGHYARWRERVAILVAALLPDIDGVLGWIDPALYGKYHRVVTHSIGGLIVLALLAAVIAKYWPEKWLLPRFRPKADSPRIANPSYPRLLAVTSITTVFHFLGDWIGAWGVWPLWPWKPEANFALARVNSLDVVILGMTVAAWAIQNFALAKGRRKTAWVLPVVWLALVVVYVWLRPYFGAPAYV